MKTPLPHFKTLLLACAVLFCGSQGAMVNAQTLDREFQVPTILAKPGFTAVKAQADGKVLVSGDASLIGTRSVASLTRLKVDGTIDAIFKSALPQGTTVHGIEFLRAGEILAYNSSYIYKLKRDGKLLKSMYIGNISAVEVLSDNSFIVVGYGYVRKYNGDFTPAGRFTNVNTNGWVRDLEIVESQIVIVGDFTEVNGIEKYEVARLDADGSLDEEFDTGSGSDQEIRIIKALPDGKFILGGYYVNYFNGYYVNGLWRLNADGSLDDSFYSDYEFGFINDIIVNGNDDYTVATYSDLVRVTDYGDDYWYLTDYAGDNIKVARMADQSMIIGNAFGFTEHGVAKVDSNGGHISTFAPAYARVGNVNKVVESGENVLIAGDFFKVGNHYTNHLALLDREGQPVTTFTSYDDYWSVNSMVPLNDGNFLVLMSYNIPYKVTPSGEVDWDFFWNWYSWPNRYYAQNMVKYDDNSLLYANIYSFGRINENGTAYGGFTTQSIYYNNIWEADVDVQPLTGGIIISGYMFSLNGNSVKPVTRLNSNGTIDTSFDLGGNGPNSYVTDIVALQNDEVLAKGYFSYWNDTYTPYQFVKLGKDGALDMEFLENINSQGIYLERPFAFRNKIAGSAWINGYTIASIEYNGKLSRTSFAPRTVSAFNNITSLYAPDNNRLYVTGQIAVKGKRAMQSIIRVNYPAMDMPQRIVNEDARVATRREEKQAEPKVKSGSFKVYPNPTADFIKLEINEPATVKILSMDGQEKINSFVNGSEDQIDIRSLAPGRYVVKIATGGKVKTRHFVVK